MFATFRTLIGRKCRRYEWIVADSEAHRLQFRMGYKCQGRVNVATIDTARSCHRARHK
jgi:hypothetical protein